MLSMKIQICGSMTFAKEMKRIKEKLEKYGHNVTVPTNTKDHIADPSFADNLTLNFQDCVNNNTIKANFDLVAKADAILVVNHAKNAIEGYLGTSTLMEIGLAYYLGKKIFLLNKIPHFSEVRWAHEVLIMQPIIINGDLNKIN